MPTHIPTYRDYIKVAKSLRGDPWFDENLGKRMIKVYKPSGESLDFPDGVIAIVNFMAAKGHEPAVCIGTEIQAEAQAFFAQTADERKEFYPDATVLPYKLGAAVPEAPAAASTPAEPAAEPRRRRIGRPPGSRNKVAEPAAEPRRRRIGRPPGSRNKVAEPAPGAAPEPVAPRQRRGRARRAFSAPAAADAATPVQAARIELSVKDVLQVCTSASAVYVTLACILNTVRELLDRNDRRPQRNARIKQADDLLNSVTNEIETISARN